MSRKKRNLTQMCSNGRYSIVHGENRGGNKCKEEVQKKGKTKGKDIHRNMLTKGKNAGGEFFEKGPRKVAAEWNERCGGGKGENHKKIQYRKLGRRKEEKSYGLYGYKWDAESTRSISRVCKNCGFPLTSYRKDYYLGKTQGERMREESTVISES
ncbi:unnamed protein product [Allacma fusca]|uniref:Uncharacterized protein n=1 Tax=Allacma fusca TaxID=39272 RepID=A0A8J2KM56_9HEXA|nr:unnamed protein product [Allacma fusca]